MHLLRIDHEDPWIWLLICKCYQTSQLFKFLPNIQPEKLPLRSFFVPCLPPGTSATDPYLKHKEANSLHWASHLPAKGKTWKASYAVATGLHPLWFFDLEISAKQSWDLVYMVRIWEDSNILENISLSVVFLNKKRIYIGLSWFCFRLLDRKQTHFKTKCLIKPPLDWGCVWGRLKPKWKDPYTVYKNMI